jgi:hypothetical protein
MLLNPDDTVMMPMISTIDEKNFIDKQIFILNVQSHDGNVHFPEVLWGVHSATLWIQL